MENTDNNKYIELTIDLIEIWLVLHHLRTELYLEVIYFYQKIDSFLYKEKRLQKKNQKKSLGKPSKKRNKINFSNELLSKRDISLINLILSNRLPEMRETIKKF